MRDRSLCQNREDNESTRRALTLLSSEKIGVETLAISTSGPDPDYFQGGRPTRLALGLTGVVVAYLLAVIVGLGSAWYVLRAMTWSSYRVQSGQWMGSTLAGSPQADLHTRARVALEGLLALGRAETIYYVAEKDDKGQRLKSRCNYRIEGFAPEARWWSVTAYAEDYFLFNAPNDQFSINASNARLDAQGRFALSTGPAPQGEIYWLPTPGDRHLVLTLRLYNPSAALQASPGSLKAPSITPVGNCS